MLQGENKDSRFESRGQEARDCSRPRGWNTQSVSSGGG